MNSKMLQAPLIQSAALLVVISLLVYLTATSPEGSILASIGALFMALVRIVQLSLGLVLAMIFCLAVLTGIFLGCVAVISRESAAGMVGLLRQEISDKLLYVRSLVIKDTPASKAGEVQKYNEGLKVEMQNIDDAAAREDVESMLHQLARQEKVIQEFSGALHGIKEKIAGLQATVDELEGQVASEKSGKTLDEVHKSLEDLQKSSASLQDELAQIEVSVPVEDRPAQKDSAPDEDLVEHRLFAYLKNTAMQEKVAKLVTETLGKKMSYAQVMDHLVKQTKGKTAEIIAAHPSLTKEYIRYRRNNG